MKKPILIIMLGLLVLAGIDVFTIHRYYGGKISMMQDSLQVMQAKMHIDSVQVDSLQRLLKTEQAKQTNQAKQDPRSKSYAGPSDKATLQRNANWAKNIGLQCAQYIEGADQTLGNTRYQCALSIRQAMTQAGLNQDGQYAMSLLKICMNNFDKAVLNRTHLMNADYGVAITFNGHKQYFADKYITAMKIRKHLADTDKAGWLKYQSEHENENY